MNIDWEELNKGMQDALEKSAVTIPKILTSAGTKIAPAIGRVVTPKNVAIGGGLATAGFGLQNGVNAAQQGISSAMDTGSQYLPSVLGMLTGSGKSPVPGGAGGPITVNVTKGTPTMFSARGVNTMGEGLKLANEKQADIFDAVGNVALRRTINSALDTMGTPDKAGAPAPHEKELELVSQYPEMEKLLEDKQNKAYLERLLKEQ